MFLLLAFLPVKVLAQFHNGSSMNFGKNRVQWGNTIWFFHRFDKFDTYFYLNGTELSLYTARYAESQLPVLERRLQVVLNEKVQFIVFNSLGDLKQSNIGLASGQQYNTGGITHIIGNKVFIYFDGDYLNFEKQIRAGLAEILINQLMFGNSLGSQIKNTALFQLPDWYKKGLLSFIAEDWNTILDSRMREGIQLGRFRKINRLEGEDALIAGHSFWRFVETKYGASSIPDIVHYTQGTRSVQKGFLSVTGLKFKQLNKDWHQHYEQLYNATENITPSRALPLKYRTYRTFNRPDFSPDERYLSYTTSDEGLLKLWLLDLKTGKKKRMYKTGYSTNEKFDTSFPLTAWHPSGEIFAFVIEEKGKIFLCFYNLSDKTTEKRIMFDFQKITHISYSGDGRQLAMAATRQGKPDIYVFDLASNSHIQITNDYYTDLFPTFTQANKTIVFSSNRTSDSLMSQNKPDVQMPTFDLFSYDISKRDKVLRRLTQTPLISETKPILESTGVINFLSDATGYFNIHSGAFDSAVAYVDTTVHYRYFMKSAQRTNFSTNILDFASAPLSENFYAVTRQNNRQKIYHLTPDEVNELPETVGVTPYMQQKIDLLEKSNALITEQPVSRRRFKSLFRPAQIADSVLQDPIPARQGAFGIGQSQRLSMLNQGKETQIGDHMQDIKRRNYFVEYFYDALVTQLDFTYINYNYQPFAGGGSPIYLNPGGNFFTGVNLIDLLEDYRISGGVRLNSSLTNNEYAFSYSNLKQRLDKHLILHRQIVEDTNSRSYWRTHSHQAFYMLSWPFSETLSLKGTAIFRNDMKVFVATDRLNLKKPNTYENWGGLRGELVFDNTRQIGTNLMKGMRWKIFGEYYQLLDSKSRNFVVLGLDFRHYQRVHRNIIWANRFAASTSFGNNKLIYYMGGVDNWLLPKFDNETPIDYNKNYAYQTLATNLRGFNQNIRNGNSFFVANTELRFPVFSYFLERPISSDFIKDFQLVAFSDLGTAWTGWNPYNASNSLYTRYIRNGPLTISVEIQKDPLVGGMGFGARTKLLGYFVRADMAWGIEDARFTKPVFYLSFNLDF